MTKKAISLAEFKELSRELQLDVLHRDGVHVGKRTIDHQTILLFQLYTFYIEVYYQEYRKVINQIIISDSADMLQPYLDQVHVRDLDGKEEK